MIINFKVLLSFLLLIGIGVFTFTHSGPEIPKQNSQNDLPKVTITTTESIVDEPKTKGEIQIFSQDSLVFSSAIGIEFRGAVSQMMSDKKSYGFEIRDNKNKDVSKSVLNMPKGEDWILYGPYQDKTLIKNNLAYSLSNKIGRYAPKSKFVELEVNTKYGGIYVLMEKIKRGENRINIKKLSQKDSLENNMTGGYILALDKTVGNGYSDFDAYNETNSFRSKYDDKGKISSDSKTHFLFEYPKKKDISETQKNYIKTYINAFEGSLLSNNFTDHETGFRKYIDQDTFIDYLILTELARNHDGYRISTYLQKDKDEKLKMGPIWDFDLAFGAESFCGSLNANKQDWVFNYNNYCADDAWLVPFWWKRLLKDKEFVEKLQVRWKTLRKNALSNNSLSQSIDKEYLQLLKSGAAQRNFEKWKVLSNGFFSKTSKNAYQIEIENLRKWLINRAEWIDLEILKL
jgi:spore coat protein CotH